MELTQILKNKKIVFNDKIKLEIFQNHIKEFLDRLISNKQLNIDIEKTMLSEISRENILLAKEIAIEISGEKDILDFEIFLISTHLQLRGD